MFFVVGFGVAADSRFVRRSSRKSDRGIFFVHSVATSRRDSGRPWGSILARGTEIVYISSTEPPCAATCGDGAYVGPYSNRLVHEWWGQVQGHCGLVADPLAESSCEFFL